LTTCRCLGRARGLRSASPPSSAAGAASGAGAVAAASDATGSCATENAKP